MKGFKKAVISVLIVTLVLFGAVQAYIALTTTGEVVVKEALSFVGESTFSVSLYPQESTTATVTVANASSLPMEVNLLSSVNPDPGGKGLTVSIPNKITIPAVGQVGIVITVAASKSVTPGTYLVTIEIDR